MMFFRSAVLLLLLLISAAMSAVEIGESAPAFKLETLGGAATRALTDYHGKIVLLDFWASWCGPCRKSLPSYNQMYAELGDQNFEIIAINIDEDPTDGLLFLERYAVDYLVLKDPGASVPRNTN